MATQPTHPEDQLGPQPMIDGLLSLTTPAGRLPQPSGKVVMTLTTMGGDKDPQPLGPNEPYSRGAKENDRGCRNQLEPGTSDAR